MQSVAPGRCRSRTYDGNDKLDREEILSKIPESRNGSLQILLGTLADEKRHSC